MSLNIATNRVRETSRRCLEWALQERHKARAAQLRDEVERAFTEHPRQTGETYLQHLWFTFCMSFRLLAVGVVLFTHGLLPFAFTRTASGHIECVYRMMKERIPRDRRQAIDAEYDI